MATASFLSNKYWILRHGKSIPNEKGLIVSSIENGILPEYQLAPEGVEQAQLAGEQFLKELKENSTSLENVRICYSPFSRTIHTAKVAASVLNLSFEGPQCKMMEDLRERSFGPSFELLSHDKKFGLLMRKIHSSGLKVEKALKMLLQGLPKQFFKLSPYFKGVRSWWSAMGIPFRFFRRSSDQPPSKKMDRLLMIWNQHYKPSLPKLFSRSIGNLHSSPESFDLSFEFQYLVAGLIEEDYFNNFPLSSSSKENPTAIADGRNTKCSF
ncbi:uncharacterized protein LOC120088380 isoform X1 [Benincasa hispida]|uniref:uncharacterized protein LOC120088380 isoform X1 n=1 Tax=Benincasa hispida TaxID=102211 RepID=UPI001901FDE2|nr:uncharacterized protein LOC120088380 isoform X1 [Benincasa hispida]XP_038901552.1 uncharacterized protein LOC120088380 isoform X1 [Benincasa hispida]